MRLTSQWRSASLGTENTKSISYRLLLLLLFSLSFTSVDGDTGCPDETCCPLQSRQVAMELLSEGCLFRSGVSPAGIMQWAVLGEKSCCGRLKTGPNYEATFERRSGQPCTACTHTLLYSLKTCQSSECIKHNLRHHHLLPFFSYSSPFPLILFHTHEVESRSAERRDQRKETTLSSLNKKIKFEVL